MSAPDPIHAAVAVAEAANAAHTAALDGLDEDDDAQMRRANAAAQATGVAFEAVQQTMPATLSGLLALTEFYARDAELYERSSSGSSYLKHVASALAVFAARENQAPLPLTDRPIRETTGVPDQHEVEAAWRALPPEARDRIGIIAVDMVFQDFVYGDACVASGQPEDRALPDESDEHDAIRAAAAEASNRRLNELTPLIQGLLPDLFGPDGENPEWAVAMGARR